MNIIMNSDGYQLGQKLVKDYVYKFPDKYKDGNLLLAYYASVPGVFTTDMLYQILAQFGTFQIGIKTNQIHYISVSDLVLSELCDEIGYELFEMETSVQHYLQSHPKEFFDKFDFLPPRKSLAAFTYQYANKFFDHPLKKNIRDVLYWKALSILSPEYTANKIVEILEKKDANQKLSIEDVSLMLHVLDIEDTLDKEDTSKVIFSKFPLLSEKNKENSFYSMKISHPSILKKFYRKTKKKGVSEIEVFDRVKKELEPIIRLASNINIESELISFIENRREETPFIIKTWLDETGDGKSIIAILERHFYHNHENPFNHFIFLSWLNNIGKPDVIKPYIKKYLDEGNIEENQAIIVSWLNRDGEKSLIQPYLLRYLGGDATKENSYSLIKSWLDAKGSTKLIQPYLLRYLKTNSNKENSHSLLTSWLNAGGKRNIIEPYVIKTKKKQQERKAKILLIDKDIHFMNLLMSAFQNMYNFTAISLMEEVMVELERNEFDLVLLELYLSNDPSPIGFSVIEEIRRIDSRIPIIVCTMDDTRETTHKAFTKYKVDEIIVKTEGSFEIWAKKIDRVLSNNPRVSVFISYTRKDRPFVNFLIKKLQSARIEVVYDEKPYVADENFSAKISRNIKECDYFMVILTKDSVYESRWLTMELNFVIRTKGFNKIIPIKVEDFRLTDDLDFLLGDTVLFHIDQQINVPNNLKIWDFLDSGLSDKLTNSFNQQVEKIINRIYGSL